MSTLQAQQIKLSGKVQDTVQNPIANTNLIATPVGEGHDITFAISDQKGRYKLKLEKDVRYGIAISNLGFSKIKDTVTLSADQTKNYTLHESHESLEQVVIKSKMAVVVKEDTITYRTDKFKTGEERKLREVLKKLPGVEVDRDGNVKVNGKKVTKLMVDGKDFFGGDTKLGVNNIPADAVDEVEALDNYSEVDFMKSLKDSDKMALNVKLKKGKKHFVFGESEAGGGVDDRYYVQPTLFYYSPETTVNFIGSLNNTGDAPLDYEDLIRFRGGYSSFLDDPIDTGNDGLRQFSSSRNIRFQKTEFGAANLSQQINSALRLDAYTIAAQQKTEGLTTNDITYLTQDNLQENRENTTENKGFSSISKVKLRYKPSDITDIAYNAIVTAENSSYFGRLLSKTADSLNRTTTAQDPHNLEVAQFFRLNRQASYEHTWEITGNYTYKERDYLTDWNFDRPVFPDIIPVQEDNHGYNLLHDYSSITNKGRLNAKHYWVLNNFNHLYPKVGLYFFNQSYHSTDFQRLQNGNRNSFRPSGFDNALSYQLIDPYIGFQYKFKVDDFIFKPGIVYHNYLWKAEQFGKTIADEQKGVFLPELLVEYTLSSSEKFKLNYNLKSRFQDAAQYANRLRLTSFNQIYRGNEDLANELYHQVSLNYHVFNMFRGITLYTNLNYKRREKSIRNSTQLEGINQIKTPIYSDLPENTYGFWGRFSKKWGDYKLSLNGNVSLSDYSRIINDETIGYNSQHYRYGLSGETRFKEWPNLELGIDQNFSSSKSDAFDSKFMSANPYARLRYDFWDGFILKMDYDYTYYENRSRNEINRFEIGNASLYYSQEDSPWGFELRAENVFDVRYKNSNSFDQFMVYDRRTYIQPRTLLFVLSYQL